MTTASASPLWLYTVQFIFLATGVFSTCAAQYIFYQGAGDQKAMLLPLCNFLGIMLVGLIPVSTIAQTSTTSPKPQGKRLSDVDSIQVVDVDECDEPERTGASRTWERNQLIRRPGGTDSTHEDDDSDEGTTTDSDTASTVSRSSLTSLDANATGNASSASPVSVLWSMSTLQLCIGLSVFLDFGGCIFSNIGLAMAGSGLYQVVYSSVICWSALLSRFVLKKAVSKEEWFGIALVTFGLAFSALGQSGGGRNSYVVLMGCFNTLLGAAFYGGNYVTGEYMLKLPERPHPKELCLKIGAACVCIIAVYQLFFVLPSWHELVTKPIEDHHGNTTGILLALFSYTISQLAHGLTYFQMLGSSGAVTTGIMQSLRAVCVFIISSILYCSQQESQCFDTKRGVATMIVVSGVMFYSWAKSQAHGTKAVAVPSRKKKTKLIDGKNFVV